MVSENEKNKTRIDLGLGAILAGVPAAPTPEMCADLSADATSSWTLGDTAPPRVQSEYEILADKREWREIVRRAEGSLSHEGTDVEARAWWIRGHLGGFSMPVSLLAAPMESLLRSVDAGSLSESARRILEESAVLTVSRLDEVGESEQSRSLRSALEPLNITVEKDSSGRPRKVTSSFRAADFVAVPPAVLTEVAVAEQGRAGNLSRKPIVLGAIMATLLLVALDYCVQSGWFSAPLSIASESFVRDGSSVEQSIVALEPKDPVGRLGALFYAIDEPDGKVEGADTHSTVSGGNLKPQVPAEGRSEQSASLGGDEKRNLSKDTVDTKGPVEGPDFSDRVERRREREAAEGGPLAGGAPKAVLPQSNLNAASEAGRIFRVLARTDVVSAPSFGGRVIGVLDAGDRVLVEGVLGRWLRLRSRRGRGGYVLARDAEEVNPDRGEVGQLPDR